MGGHGITEDCPGLPRLQVDGRAARGDLRRARSRAAPPAVERDDGTGVPGAVPAVARRDAAPVVGAARHGRVHAGDGNADVALDAAASPVRHRPVRREALPELPPGRHVPARRHAGVAARRAPADPRCGRTRAGRPVQRRRRRAGGRGRAVSHGPVPRAGGANRRGSGARLHGTALRLSPSSRVGRSGSAPPATSPTNSTRSRTSFPASPPPRASTATWSRSTARTRPRPGRAPTPKASSRSCACARRWTAV